MREPRYSTADVAARVGVHRDTLLRWLREGRIPEPARDRNDWRTFTPTELEYIRHYASSGGDNAAAGVVRETAPPYGDVLARLRELDWDFAGAKTNYLTHGLHPYPAKFIPQIPNALIQELSSVGDVVADIFCGSGTTIVEALTLKRHAVGIDANPLACLITEAKTTQLSEADATSLQELAANAALLGIQLSDADIQQTLFASADLLKGAVPVHRAIEFWFTPTVVEELAHIRTWIDQLSSVSAQTLARAAFSSIIVAVSRQDSDTRYVRRDKNVGRGDTLRKFARALQDAIRGAFEFTEIVEERFTRRVLHTSVLDSPDVGPLDLVVCSPPYPNAYSYHLYHMTRMLWLDLDQPTFKKAEIGSHRKYSAKGPNAATNETFGKEMSIIFQWLRRHLRPNRYACFVVGDSVIGGRRYNNADTIAGAAATYGFIEVARIERRLQDTKKAFNPAIGKIRQEHVLILEKRRSD